MRKLDNYFYSKGYDLDVLLNDVKKYEVTNLKKAAITILKAILSGLHIFVVADYDCDGVMSATNLYTIFVALSKIPIEKMVELLYDLGGITEEEKDTMLAEDKVKKAEALREQMLMSGSTFTIRFPKRIEGYGISEKIVDEAPEGSLIVTIDNGIAAVEAVKYARDKGHTVVILDHHQIRGDGLIPDADVVVDPHIYKEPDEFEHYCGAGIAHKLAEELKLPKDVTDKTVTWAALATIADVVPLVDDNRNIVRAGLLEINRKAVEDKMPVVDLPGLFSLCGQLNLKPTTSMIDCINEEDVKFQIAPCINAMGRMYEDGAKMAFEYLIHYDVYGEDGIRTIVECNGKRKEVTAEQQVLLDEQAEQIVTPKTTCIVLYVPGLHEGIIGINAARVCENYNMPAIVLTDAAEEGFLKGSARSVEGIHIKECLDKSADFVYKYGGHAGAAGLTVEKSKLKDFVKAINKATPKANVCHNTWQYDFEITEDEVVPLMKALRRYAPYGEGFPAPIVKLNNFRLTKNYGKYYKFIGQEGVSFKSYTAEAVSFNMREKYKELNTPMKMNLVGTVGYSRYSKMPQIMLNDFQPVLSDFESQNMDGDGNAFLI